MDIEKLDGLDIMRYYREREKIAEKFYDEKKYNELILKIIDKDNDSENWDIEDDIMFSFLFGKAEELAGIEEEVNIRYEDKVINLFEIHGQGCYRRFKIIDSADYCIDYEDLVEFHETGKKPLKYTVLDILDRAFDTLSCAHNSEVIEINGQKINLEEVKYYIINKIL